MQIGLIDVDGHNYPNLALMRISAYHKSRGDTVGWYGQPLIYHDMVTDSPDPDMGRDCGHFIRSQRWIPVTERLPDTDKDVLVYATTKFIGGSKIAIDKLEEGEQRPIWLYTHGWFEVTHWMPLPEPPEVSE